MTDISSPSDNDMAFVEAVFRYQDGELSGEMLKRLNELLSTSVRHRKLFNEIALQSLALKEYGSAGESGAELGHEAARSPAHRGHRELKTSRRRSAVVAASLIVVLVICLGFWSWPDGSNALTIEVVNGDVVITNERGESRPARAGDELAADDTLTIEDSSASIELTQAASLRINVSGPAEATWGADRDLIVHAGEFEILVSAESPLQFETPHASLAIQNAEFALLAADTWTEIDVRSGQVTLARGSAGEVATVVADETAIAQQGFPLVIHETTPAVPTEWREDFENGLPFGWEGQFVANGLPGDSSGGVGVKTESRSDATQFLIEASDQAVDVLLTGNSHLNLTCRITAPTWFNLFILTRDIEGGEPDYVLNRFQTAPFLNRAGAWQTVRIPIAEFEAKSGGEFTDQPPAVGDVLVGVVFSAFDNDLDLVIDEISITSDGPGTVMFERSEE